MTRQDLIMEMIDKVNQLSDEEIIDILVKTKET